MTETLRTRQMSVTIAIYAAITLSYLSSLESAGPILILVPFLALAALTTTSDTVRFGTVLGIAVIVGLAVLAHYYRAANHGFMLFWVGLGIAFASACSAPRNLTVLARNSAILLALLMFIALIQKLRSTYYMEGDLLGGFLVDGEVYSVLIGFVIPEWPTLLQDYRTAFDAAMASSEVTTAALAIPPAVVAFSWRMTIGSLVAQAVLELMILFRAKAGIYLHLATLGFVALVYSTRNENTFLSINLLLGYAMTDERSAKVRPWYVVAVIYLITAEVVDYRPYILR